jgi:hypothetical protein
MSALSGPVRAVSAAGGQVLRAATRLVAVRPAAKPLHPDGAVVRGTLHRYGGGQRSGVRWLDEPGEDDVLVRQSRAVGLPDPAPDIFGVAIRVPRPDGGHGDLLFASTGLGRVTRYTLTASRSPYGRPLTTLLPYRSPAGPVLLAATWSSETELSLAWARGSGSWQGFGDLTLHGDPIEGPDAEISFDPLRHELPGLANYDAVRRLREPAYLTARRTRS